MKKIIIICFLFTFKWVFAQENKSKNSKNISMVFERKWTQNTKVIDSIEKSKSSSINRKALNNFIGDSIETETFVMSLDQIKPSSRDGVTMTTYFNVNSDFYIEYTIQDNAIKNNSIRKIDRNTLEGVQYKTINLKISDAIIYFLRNDFEIDYIDKKDVKQLHGFECYKVVLKEKNSTFYWILYVTEEIKLNYHPAFRHKALIKKFYPLEIIMRHEKYDEAYQMVVKLIKYQEK